MSRYSKPPPGRVHPITTKPTRKQKSEQSDDVIYPIKGKKCVCDVLYVNMCGEGSFMLLLFCLMFLMCVAQNEKANSLQRTNKRKPKPSKIQILITH